MLVRLSLTVLTALITGALWAAPPLTTIRDTVYNADGSRFTGQIIIDWRSFEASDSSFIGRQRLQVDIYNGALDIRLVPTTNANSSAYYSITYSSGGNMQFQEYWAVRPSTTPLRVRDIRITDPLQGPGSSTTGGGGSSGGVASGPIYISDVTGLQTELDIRARKGPSYGGGVAVINLAGELEAASGNPADCLRVDGTSGPCGSGGSAAPVVGTFVDGEIPTGATNGSNNTFGLSQVPNPSTSLLLYRNGMLQKQGLDYSLTNQNITFIPQAIPQPGDVLLASYRTAGSGGTLPQVLCTAQGNANGTNTVVSLGSCTIPANLLRAGDRVELMFDYSHQGVLSPFTYQVKWGATQLTSRTVSATANLASGRSSISIFAGAAQASTLAWGSGGLALQGDAVTATDSIINTITIDFQAGLATASTDTVTLRNYSVVRYPAP